MIMFALVPVWLLPAFSYCRGLIWFPLGLLHSQPGGKALTKCLTFVFVWRKYLKGVLVGRDGGLDESFWDDKDSVFVPGEVSSLYWGVWTWEYGRWEYAGKPWSWSSPWSSEWQELRLRIWERDDCHHTEESQHDWLYWEAVARIQIFLFCFSVVLTIKTLRWTMILLSPVAKTTFRRPVSLRCTCLCGMNILCQFC